ncbi:MAG: hypothetical protein A2017_04480 [Lentisphaerae bacterium GWF2_44_16]|nr:MAG: hypothetical protein A2017_04480 [Lentisphaerae bacterium GWF2_44_16]
MTAAEKVMISLKGGHSNSVPFTMYGGKAYKCRAEREMRNRGMCIVERTAPVFKTRTPNVKIKSEVYAENGKTMTRTYYETPVGTLTNLREAAGFTSWLHEKLFKSPDDYKALLFIIRDEIYEPCYDAFIKAEKAFGGDAIFRAGFGLEPLQTLISGGYIDMQDFCMEWMDNRDEILKLYEAIVEQRRKVYPLVAASPASHANYGGNVVSDIIGLETFEKYYVPHYNEAADIMHKHGKLIGTHLDANCRLLSKAVAGTRLDYIEAFTPSPDTDMTLGEARDAWKDKVLWLNFPSSVHLKTDEEVKQKTIDMLDELSSIDGIIMGITEDIPEDRWQNSCTAIMDGLDAHSKSKTDLYR